MPIGPNSFLSLLTFPQFWDGASLSVRFLCLPKGDPFQPLRPGLSPFTTANLVFEANMIGSLARLPQPADATPTGPLVMEGPPLYTWFIFVSVLYLIASDFFQVARLVAFIQFWRVLAVQAHAPSAQDPIRVK